MYRWLVIVLGLSVAGCFTEEQAVQPASGFDLPTAEFDSIAWPGEYAWPGPSSTSRSVQPQSSSSVASVSSLVSGLQERLARKPGDVKGWALLAQSYAFMADGSRAEEAIARAVELGFDEADLRRRVEMASESARAPNQTESNRTHPVLQN